MALEKGIDKLVQEFIAAGRPSSRKQSIDDRRSGYVASTALAGEKETRVQVETLVIEDLTFRVFSPVNAPETLPCAFYYHGGCFVSGGFDTHDNQLRQLAFHSHSRVIAVQYRLAPEHTFPAAHDDAERAADLIWHNAEKLGVDKNRVTLCGDSAGAHLALVTSLRLKTKGVWQAAQLILIYPMLDATASFESYILNGADCLAGMRCISQTLTVSIPKPAHCGGMIFTVFPLCTSLPQSTIRCVMKEKCCIST